MNGKSGYILLLFLGIVFSNTVPSLAQGDLLVTPKRVAFVGTNKRVETVLLSNLGKDTAKYNISLLHLKMIENGGLEYCKEGDTGVHYHYADKFVRIFPRSVTLAPGDVQSIRIQLTNISNLTDGEYRSHLYFRSVEDEKPLGTKAVSNAKDSGVLSVRLKAIFGISIPLIIRQGVNVTKDSIGEVALEVADTAKPTAIVSLYRTVGTMSIYGHLHIDYVAAEGGHRIPVGAANGISIYSPIVKRKITLSLQKKPGVDYRKGKLIVQFETPIEGRKSRITEKELEL